MNKPEAVWQYLARSPLLRADASLASWVMYLSRRRWAEAPWSRRNILRNTLPWRTRSFSKVRIAVLYWGRRSHVRAATIISVCRRRAFIAATSVWFRGSKALATLTLATDTNPASATPQAARFSFRDRIPSSEAFSTFTPSFERCHRSWWRTDEENLNDNCASLRGLLSGHFLNFIQTRFNQIVSAQSRPMCRRPSRRRRRYDRTDRGAPAIQL